MKKILIGLLIVGLVLISGCFESETSEEAVEDIMEILLNETNETYAVQEIYIEEGLEIYEVTGIFFTFIDLFNKTNMTKREKQYYSIGQIPFYYYPLNISIGKDTPSKIYKDFTEIPLENDCYNETRCWVKWDID